jgi:hypothetical protein
MRGQRLRPLQHNSSISAYAALHPHEARRPGDHERCLLQRSQHPQRRHQLPHFQTRNLVLGRSFEGDTIAWLVGEQRERLGGRHVSCPYDMEELMAKDKCLMRNEFRLCLFPTHCNCLLCTIGENATIGRELTKPPSSRAKQRISLSRQPLVPIGSCT